MNRKAFTLVELLFVFTITGFLGPPDEEEILKHLTNLSFASGVKLALTHGGENRKNLYPKVKI